MKMQIVILGLAGAFLILNSPVLAIDRLVPSQYSTIQAAIDDCNNGDVVIAEPNIYTGPGNRDIDFKGLAITVRSIDPEDPCVVAATVIDCENVTGHRGFYFHSGEGANSIVSGFTIKRGKITGGNAKGGGIYCSESSPTVENCIIADNSAFGADGYPGKKAYGAGIYCELISNPVIANCTISNNHSKGGTCLTSNFDGANAYGGGIYSTSDSNPTIKNCILSDNKATGGKGGDGWWWDGQLTVGGNGGDGLGAGIYCDSGSMATIENCTISNNTAVGGIGGAEGGTDGTSRGGGFYGSTVISGCILWSNTAESSPQIYGGPTISYSDVEDGYSGEGNIDADPYFVDLAGGDYHLSPGSPCIDAGDPCYIQEPNETDIDGEPRVMSGHVDIGADEFSEEVAFIELTPAAFEFIADEGGTNPDTQILSIRNSGGGTLNWEIREDCNWLTVEPNIGSSTGEVDEVNVGVDISGLVLGLYNCELTITASGALNSPQTVGVTLFIGTEGELHVPGHYETIQAAIDAADAYDIIIVADGTYTGSGNYDIDFGGKAILLRSANGPENCIINCQNAYPDRRGFYFHSGEDANSIVSGFTIKRGRVSGNNAKGGGIHCSGSSPTIEDCIITNNTAIFGRHAYGGGIYCVSNSNPVIIGCTISGNRAKGYEHNGGYAYGGGIYCTANSNPVITGCTISGNRAQGGRGGDERSTPPEPPGSGGRAYGGGIYCSSTAIENCIVASNVAEGGDGGDGIYGMLGAGGGSAAGGGIYCGAGTTIENCTVVSNTATGGQGGEPAGGNGASGAGGIRAAATTTITDCIIWGNSSQVSGTPGISYSDVEGGYAGEGNINADPCFVTGPLGDYYLSQVVAGQAFDSLCVDAGSDTAANLEMDEFTTRTDEIGDGGIVDMGYHYSMPNPADINKDWVVDMVDYVILASQWRQEPGIPSADIAPPGGDVKVNEKDLALLVDNWLWEK